jgi:predicted Zn-dependent protease
LATTIWENDGQSDAIVKGDIIMNAELYQFVDAMEDQDTDSNRDIADSESVLVHELGHLIGLDHVSLEKDSLSVMHAQTQIGHQISFRDLSPADMANIRTLYP